MSQENNEKKRQLTFLIIMKIILLAESAIIQLQFSETVIGFDPGFDPVVTKK